jgi:hypothetical protein
MYCPGDFTRCAVTAFSARAIAAVWGSCNSY